jgi:iron complex transport system ATP-binding protein
VSLRVDKVSVRYGDRHAAKDCSFSIDPGEFIALIGPNGAGKSSLLRAIAGLVPKSGRTSWAGRPIADRASRERARTIAFLPQTPEIHWPMQVRELVALGRLPHLTTEALTRIDRDCIDAALEATSTAHLADRPVDQLSGGERTLVQLARTLAVRAPCLIVDEPAASLDPRHQLLVMGVLARHAADGGLVIAVMHDLTLSAKFCQRVILMRDGAIQADGSPTEVLTETMIREVFRVRPFLAEADDASVVVPWQLLD